MMVKHEGKLYHFGWKFGDSRMTNVSMNEALERIYGKPISDELEQHTVNYINSIKSYPMPEPSCCVITSLPEDHKNFKTSDGLIQFMKLMDGKT